MEAGGKLDAEVAKNLLGCNVAWRLQPYCSCAENEHGSTARWNLRVLPHFSTDWNAAALVVDKLAERFWWRIVSPFCPGEPWLAGLTPHGTSGWNGRPDIQADGKTGPEAICLCALKAVALGMDGLSGPEEQVALDEDGCLVLTEILDGPDPWPPP